MQRIHATKAYESRVVRRVKTSTRDTHMHLLLEMTYIGSWALLNILRLTAVVDITFFKFTVVKAAG